MTEQTPKNSITIPTLSQKTKLELTGPPKLVRTTATDTMHDIYEDKMYMLEKERIENEKNDDADDEYETDNEIDTHWDGIYDVYDNDNDDSDVQYFEPCESRCNDCEACKCYIIMQDIEKRYIELKKDIDDKLLRFHLKK